MTQSMGDARVMTVSYNALRTPKLLSRPRLDQWVGLKGPKEEMDILFSIPGGLEPKTVSPKDNVSS